MLAGKGSVASLEPDSRGPEPSSEAWDRLVVPYRAYLEEVGDLLGRQIGSFEPEIARFASYAIANPGKRLRPLMVGLAGGARHGFGRSLVAVGTIVEMIHLATLVHDDVLDSAQIRRSRPTLARGTGNKVAVLLGDCLFAHALTMAASEPDGSVCHAVALATRRVCSGEILQSLQESGRSSLDGYLKMVEMKTGELFGLSCELGASRGDGFAGASGLLRQVGLALGTAYQIYDDCLDLFVPEDYARKTVGTDLVQGKLTLPLILLLDAARGRERQEILEGIESRSPERLPWIRERLESHRILDRCFGAVCSRLDQARPLLEELTPSHDARDFFALADYLEAKMRELGEDAFEPVPGGA